MTHNNLPISPSILRFVRELDALLMSVMQMNLRYSLTIYLAREDPEWYRWIQGHPQSTPSYIPVAYYLQYRKDDKQVNKVLTQFAAWLGMTDEDLRRYREALEDEDQKS